VPINPEQMFNSIKERAVCHVFYPRMRVSLIILLRFLLLAANIRA
jgi:hypothetical protein